MKFILTVIMAATLSACGQTKTQDYYVAHPQELTADLAECQRAGKNTYNCNEATKAALILKKKDEAAGTPETGAH